MRTIDGTNHFSIALFTEADCAVNSLCRGVMSTIDGASITLLTDSDCAVGSVQESDELAEEQINDLKRTLGEIQVV